MEGLRTNSSPQLEMKMNATNESEIKSGHVLRPFYGVGSRPMPRIEVSIRRKDGEPDVVECDQYLIMGLQPGDGRREQYVDGQLVNRGWTSLHMGGCVRLVPESQRLVNEDASGLGWVYCVPELLARAVWDGEELGVPVFLVAEGQCQRLDDVIREVNSDETTVVYALMSDTEVGMNCSVHATRALAEAELRSDLREYTTLGQNGAEQVISDDRIDRLVVDSRHSEIQPKDLDWYKVERLKVRGARPAHQLRQERGTALAAQQE